MNEFEIHLGIWISNLQQKLVVIRIPVPGIPDRSVPSPGAFYRLGS